MGDLSIETKNIPSNDVLTGTKTEISDLRELRVGAGSSIFYTDKEGSRWGHPTFDSAKAWIKVDGTARFMSSNGDVLLSTGATDGNFVNIINTALNTSSKKILTDFTFESTDYAGAFKTGNITWSDTTGLVTGGTGIVINSRGIIGAASGVTKFSIDSTTGNATFAGTLAAPSGTLGTITSGTITGATIQTAASGYRIKMNYSSNSLEFLANNTVQTSMTTDGSNSMILTAGGNIKFALGTASQTWFMNSTGFYPNADKTGALGSSSKEWGDVYAQDYYSGSSKGATQTWDFDAGESHRFVFVSGLFISHTKL